jgi:hypothetical protein
LDSSYSSFLLRIEWSQQEGILGGEIKRAVATSSQVQRERRFRGLDLDRIAEYVRENLEYPEVGGDDDAR